MAHSRPSLAGAIIYRRNVFLFASRKTCFAPGTPKPSLTEIRERHPEISDFVVPLAESMAATFMGMEGIGEMAIEVVHAKHRLPCETCVEAFQAQRSHCSL